MFVLYSQIAYLCTNKRTNRKGIRKATDFLARYRILSNGKDRRFFFMPNERTKSLTKVRGNDAES